jgi:hypothetical protein
MPGRPKGIVDKTQRKTRFVGWTDADLNILLSSYYDMTISELIVQLNKSKSAILAKARELGLRKPCHTFVMCQIDKLNGKSGIFGLQDLNTIPKIVYLDGQEDVGSFLKAGLGFLDNPSSPSGIFHPSLILFFQYCDASDFGKYIDQFMQSPRCKLLKEVWPADAVVHPSF